MTFLYYSGLFSLLANLAVALAILWRHFSKLENRLFGIIYICIALWSIGSSLVNLIPDHTVGLWVLRANYAFGTFIPALEYHFILQLTGLRAKKRLVPFYYLLSAFFCVMCFTPFLVKNLKMVPNTEYLITNPGTIYPFYFVYFSSLIPYAFYLLFKVMRKSQGIRMHQLRYIFIGECMAFAGGIDYFSTVFMLKNFPPIDDYFLFLSGMIIAYGVVKYRLLDINLLFRDVLVHASASISIAAPFIILGVVLPKLWVSCLLFIILTLVLPLYHPRLVERFKPSINRYIFKDKYAYYEEFKKLAKGAFEFHHGTNWFGIVDIGQVIKPMLEDLVRIVRLRSANFLVYDEDVKAFQVRASVNGADNAGREKLQLSEDDELVKALKSHNPLVKEELVHQISGQEKDSGTLKIISRMQELHSSLCLGIFLDGDLRGILNLGEKTTGAIFNQEDFQALNALQQKAEKQLHYLENIVKQFNTQHKLNHDAKGLLYKADVALMTLNDPRADEEDRVSALKILSSSVHWIDEYLDDSYELGMLAVDQAKKKITMARFNLKELVQETVHLMQPHAEAKGLALTLETAPGAEEAYGQKVRIQRVVKNLITNGIKYTQKGGVKVKIDSEHGQTVIEVADTGIGIDEEDMPNIFEPLYQAKGRTQISSGGLGLGLTIVRDFVAAHKGTIQVLKNPGGGTIFRVLLPFPKEDLEAA